MSIAHKSLTVSARLPKYARKRLCAPKKVGLLRHQELSMLYYDVHIYACVRIYPSTQKVLTITHGMARGFLLAIVKLRSIQSYLVVICTHTPSVHCSPIYCNRYGSSSEILDRVIGVAFITLLLVRQFEHASQDAYRNHHI